MRRVLHEREAELAELDALIRDAAGGAGRVVVVEGPAGIGKSRLLEAARERATHAGHRVLRATASALERDFAFGAARQLFEAEIGALPAPERDRLLRGAAALSAPAVGHTELPTAPALREDRLFGVLHGLYWLSANLAAERPLHLEVDDAQWLDQPTALWLGYLARRIEDLPVALVLAVRDDPADAPAPAAALHDLRVRPQTTTLRPGPLSVGAVGAVLRGTFGVEPAAEVAAACHERSGGNPFMLRALRRAMRDDALRPEEPATAARVSAVLPGSVARAVAERLHRLPQPAVQLAEALAVLGDDTPLVHAAGVAQLDEAEAGEGATVLMAAGLVRETVPLAFAHSLVREAVLETVPPPVRVRWHWQAARVLLEAAAAPEAIAAHLLAAEPHGDPRAVEVLRAAAARALHRGAPASAVRYLARALAEPPSDDQRGGLLVELGAAEARVGSGDAVAHLEEALASRGPAALTGAAASELALGWAALGRPERAIEALERGIAVVAGGERELRLRLEGELGAMAQLDGSMTPRLVDRLAEVARGLTGATPGERLVLASHAHQRSLDLAPPDELSALADRVLSEGSLLREQSPDSPIVYLFVYVLDRAERPELVDRLLADALAEAQARGSVLGLSVALACRGFIRWLRGDLREAEADARTSVDAQLEAGWASVLPLAVATVAECLLERDRAGEACALFERSGLGGAMPELLMHRWALVSRGRARIAAGEQAAGIEDLLDCERLRMGPLATVAMLWRADAALALDAAGERDRAAALIDEQLALARSAGVARPLGVSLRVAGILAADDGERHERLAEAVEALARGPARLEHARALVDAGAALRRDGRRRTARARLEEGHELARHCGSPALVARARAELAASGVRLRREALVGIDALTPSERRVAQLAATGRTNPEIAQALFITRKTVEMHLGRVYRKLQVPGREALPPALLPEPV